MGKVARYSSIEGYEMKMSAVYSLIPIPLILYILGLILLAYFSWASNSTTSNIIVSILSVVCMVSAIFSIRNEKAYIELKERTVDEKHIQYEEMINLMPKYYLVSRLGLYKILLLLYLGVGIFPWIK
jgi:hypothetical protein